MRQPVAALPSVPAPTRRSLRPPLPGGCRPDAPGDTVVFVACASVYMIATAIIHFLLPRNRSTVVAGGVGTAAAR
jgi:hypothetical protein